MNLFLQYLDGFLQKDDILFLAATNRIEDIDPALLRAGRFDYKILVDTPDFEARKEIFKICMKIPKQKKIV
jgi:ATP-dependent 26S proteasome regulatory subunit